MQYNAYILVPLVTWAIAQVLKFSLAALRGKLDFRYLYSSGGMPSAHAAVVSSLAMTSLVLDGFGSHLFGLVVIVAAIVMYDSFGVRRSSGEQAVAINAMIEHLRLDERAGINLPIRQREVLGHTPFEVASGAILGLVLASLFAIDKLSAQIDFIQALPLRTEVYVYGAIFGTLIVLGWVLRFFLLRRYRKQQAIRQLTKQALVRTQMIGWIGIVLTFAEYERAAYLGWRVWAWVMLAALLIWLVWTIYYLGRALPPIISANRTATQRAKWMPENQKKKAKKRR